MVAVKKLLKNTSKKSSENEADILRQSILRKRGHEDRFCFSSPHSGFKAPFL
jgi:hypothetical protein